MTTTIQFIMKVSSERIWTNVGYEDKGMNTDRLIWLDLEMSGLEPETDVIIEIATIVTCDF